MTTSTINYDDMAEEMEGQIKALPEGIKPEGKPEENTAEGEKKDLPQAPGSEYYADGKTIGEYSMNNAMDEQLMHNVEQYVLQNMSRGQINLEEMSSAMGMGRVPFFHRIKAITQRS